MKVIRTNVELGERCLRQLEEIKEIMEASTRAEAIRYAIKMCNFAVKHRKDLHVQLRMDEGEKEIILL